MAKRIKATSLASYQKMSVVEGAQAYAKLREAVVAAGILDRSYGYYAVVIFLTFTGFFVSLYFLYVTTAPFILVVWAAIFGFFTVQFGGLMHDAGHRTIFKSSLANDIIGYIVCSLMVMRFSNWRVKHNKHHAHPNQDDADPDIDIAFSFTEDRHGNVDSLMKRLIRNHQVYLYYPLGAFIAFRMRVTGLRSFKENFRPAVMKEVAVFVLGLFLWFVVPFLIFPFAKALLIILVVHFVAGVYLMNIFAPNHKGMTELEKGVKLSFAEQQIITSRNINGHWLTDLLFMGLNYQIEHHLFPNTPRNKLRRITPFVKAFCKERKLEYTSVSFVETNKIILSELHQIARTTK